MKELARLQGGYKRHMDYLLTLQSEVLGVQNALLKRLNHDLVLEGCETTDHGNGTVSIAPGVVYVDGQIVRFQGANNVTADGSIALTLASPVTSDPQEFFDGSTKNIYKEVFAVLANTSNSAVQIVIGAVLYDIPKYISDIVQSYGQKGEFKDVYDFDGTFANNFDASGLGITPRWQGWALANGNNGTPNLQGRTRITTGRIVDTDGVQYVYGNGNTGGEVRHKLTVAEMPSHTHNIIRDLVQAPGSSGSRLAWWGTQGKTGNTETAGGDQAHNNMQPYFACHTVIKIA